MKIQERLYIIIIILNLLRLTGQDIFIGDPKRRKHISYLELSKTLTNKVPNYFLRKGCYQVIQSRVPNIPNVYLSFQSPTILHGQPHQH